ncbi:hypothetical protein H310_08077 [Aphanomyces invadans]|uniref:Uncharacterized protein n=1 Tax=Aphanomyces invadans TaxID=157072 RepID=A0A024TZD9_9STRA|nr:hypothetical protein H310_08077 [Aphanomyces invadans]ETV99363.1 hypothetical protein H310_08077 [Aphanomyces invadans]|eukprot:XP_008871919.1 hypothetical protein H310_08077 [Aphanomyces invadans]
MSGKGGAQRIRQAWNDSVPWVYLDPAHQNIPLDARDAHVRPPPPRMPTTFDLFIGIANYRDGPRCGFTLFTAFSRAKHPERVKIGVVDQTQDNDTACVDEYCKLAEASEWKECKFKSQIRVDARDSRTSKGPTLARWQQQQLIQDEEFCLQIDSHSQFLQDWDVLLVEEWLKTDNEMAVLTSYPMNYGFMGPGFSRPDHYASHLCTYNKRRANPSGVGTSDIPIIGGYLLVDAHNAPLMSALWGGCLSFSKCHAERRAPNDKHMNWVFWGEEYLRSMQLWTRGYDLYSPSKYGHVVFHNWSDDKGMKKRFWDNVTQVMTQEQHDMEEKLAYNRLRMVLTLPFKGPVDAEEVDKYHGGKVRSVEQFLKFSGISNTNPALDEFRCEQLHWVPYAVPEIIEAFLPGYTMRPIPGPNETNRTAGVDGTLGHQEVLVQLLQQLEALKVPSTDQLQHLREIRHEIALLNQPHEDLWPLAFVWLGVISVWLVYKNRRNADVAGGATTP